jgi:hypothetical protein
MGQFLSESEVTQGYPVQPETSTIEVFRNDAGDEGEASIGLVICDPSIVEWIGELAPACGLTLTQARLLGEALIALTELS